ncbi:MAG: hypothetical protein A2751_04810 [Candidatus Doudnabacteria bacterium RIFCSPHIGHO2_01_FULL_46_14]|uniref:Cell division protein FtsX n=1 Tax=Candidatus Doudnabacteria bacterium RIFCSPHIGHO2_01_FULL_46_14 TaxID=1817824 RepID=A0A1F5NNY7_9BACT|nr:MAG: hypothetical protein A2751_04810 [Candidatus Doudnabacteria bacterium RIFCSPHIGHO2_01_FULL_46_14]
MNKITFYRILKNGALNYSRNFWLSLAATAVMVITLFIISSLLILGSLTNISLETIKEKVDISVYFKLDVEDSIIKQIEKQVSLLPQVRGVTFIPSVTARERFKELHKDEPLLIESVEQFTDSENPFPASLAIRVNTLDDYPQIISMFEDQKLTPYVKKITDKRDIVERLSRITDGIKNLGLGLTLIFGVITVIVMFNTIRLTIYNRREEIEIMRLVGANNWYIRGPFIVEGALYGLAGSLLTSAILYPIIYVLTPKISRFLELEVQRFDYLGMDFWLLFLLLIATGLMLGVLSSTIVIRRYLKI